ncbi:MAG: iron-containing alcohol dehydrogenase [Pseudomonadota bacterium]
MTLISLATRVHFAEGVFEDALRVELDLRRLARPLVLTEAGAAARWAERLAPALPPGADVELAETEALNASEAEARALAARFGASDRDAWIAIGPGPVIDLAKAAALAGAADAPLARYAAVGGGHARIPEGLSPLIAVPTDAGAGAEAAQSVAVTVLDGRRLVIRSRRIAASAAICDPLLTRGLAPGPTAEGAVDAIAHCLEAYVAQGQHPPAEGMALAGLRGAARALRRLIEAPDDRDARREMMAAALNGGLAQDKGLGAAHAAAHALAAGRAGARHRHGRLLAALLPHAVAYNAPAIRERRAELAAALDLRPDADLADALARLASAAGLGDGLAAQGVAAHELAAAAAAAAADVAAGANPRRADAPDYLRLMRAAF